MNLILTSACNKSCSFCFAKPYVTNPDKELMTLERAKFLCEQLYQEGERISLLGGEPTLYPDFVPLLNHIKTLYRTARPQDEEREPVLLISNFLFDNETTGQAIQEALVEGVPLSFLFNVAEMSEKQLEQFKHNVKSYLKVDDTLAAISPGITLNKKLPSSYYTDILENISNYATISSIRTSVPNPMPGSISFEDYQQDEMPIYRQQLRDIIEWSIDHRVKVNFDCGITRCLFEEPLPLDFVNQWVPREQRLGCNNAALDMKPDGTLISCYPGSHIHDTLDNHNNNVAALISKVQAKKKYMTSIAEKPNVCLSCPYYLRECQGPCIGFYNTSNMEEFDG